MEQAAREENLPLYRKRTENELLALSKEIFTLLKESNSGKIAEKVDSEHRVT